MIDEKKFLLEEVQGQIKQFGSFVIMRYSGLTANAANDFRGILAKGGGSLEVVRKRLLLKAASANGITLDLSALPGHIGIVFAGEDPLETTKLVVKFGEANNGTVQVIGGRFEGQLYSGEQMEMLSKLPSKDEMRAQLLATFEAPMAQTLAVMDALLTSVVYCLDNKSKLE